VVEIRDAAADEGVIIAVNDVDPSVPADLRPFVARAQNVGRILFTLDEPAAIATDVVIACGARKDVLGYVTLPTVNEGWEVAFITNAEPVAIGYRVTLAPQAKPVCHKLDPPEPASVPQTKLFRARQAVIAAIGVPTQPLNPVVFPGVMLHEQGIIVYLLAASRDNMVVFGKHFRARTSEDGTQVRELEPMSKGAIELPQDPQLPLGATPVGLTVTQILTDYPMETHVFASLLHRKTVYVGTARGVWKVDGAKITFVKAN